MKKTIFVCAAAISLFSLADGVGKEPEPDWDKVCFMITNKCIRARHPEDAWMTIAAAKIRYKLSSAQMLEAFKRCIDGLGDSPQERMACARIVHCMNDNCGTNALPYVEYLIENGTRDGVAECAYRQLVKMETNLDRRLLFAEKILDPKSGHGNCSRIVVYQELCDIWARTERDGKHADKVKLTAFFERRRPLDRNFKYLAPQDFRPVKRDDEIDWTRVCYGISNAFINAKPPRDAYMRFAGTRNNYNLTREQLLTAFERCLNGLGDEGRELKACEQIVSCLNEVCGTNAIPCLERLAITDRRESVASCAFRELMKMKPFAEGANRPATLQEFRATKKESGR